MTRETRELTIKVGEVEHKVVLYTSMNGYDKLEMMKLVSKNKKLAELENPTMGDISGSEAMELQDFFLKRFIASIDGNASNPYDALMQMPSEVFDQVFLEVSKSINFGEKKKN